MVISTRNPFAFSRSLLPADARRFLLRLLVWFPALLFLWLPLGAVYRTTLIKAGNAAFAAFSTEREVSFLHHTRWAEIGVTEMADVAVLVRSPHWRDDRGQKQHVLAKAVCTFYQPFTACAFLLALFLASQIAWRKRLWKGGAAVVALHLAMFAVVAVDVSYAAGSLDPLAQPGSWMSTLTTMLHFSVTDWPAGVFMVPLLLWIFLCWPRPERRSGAAAK